MAAIATLLAGLTATLLFFSSTLCVAMKNNAAQTLGSKPPLCWNKCMGCRPCMATLAAFPRRRRRSYASSSPSSAAARLGEEEDESYYLLAWKCRCGNQLYQP